MSVGGRILEPLSIDPSRYPKPGPGRDDHDGERGPVPDQPTHPADGRSVSVRVLPSPDTEGRRLSLFTRGAVVRTTQAIQAEIQTVLA